MLFVLFAGDRLVGELGKKGMDIKMKLETKGMELNIKKVMQ